MVDDQFGIVGTINLDYRSLFLHFECGVWLYQTQSVAAIREDFLATQAISQQVQLEEIQQLSWANGCTAVCCGYSRRCSDDCDTFSENASIFDSLQPNCVPSLRERTCG